MTSQQATSHFDNVSTMSQELEYIKIARKTCKLLLTQDLDCQLLANQGPCLNYMLYQIVSQIRQCQTIESGMVEAARNMLAGLKE